MRARDLAEDYQAVDLDTDALEAARLLGKHLLPGLIVRGDDGLPWTVLPGSQVLRFIVPKYVQDDPALARVYDERGADQLSKSLRGKKVRDVLPTKQDATKVPMVDGDAVTVEIAAVMVRMHSPIVAVVEEGRVLGAITLRRLLAAMIDEGAETQ